MESLGKGEALYLANETLIFRNFHIRSNLFFIICQSKWFISKKKRFGIRRYPINMTHKERGKGETEPHVVLAMILYIGRGFKKIVGKIGTKKDMATIKGVTFLGAKAMQMTHQVSFLCEGP
jgi:hypothetical protein